MVSVVGLLRVSERRGVQCFGTWFAIGLNVEVVGGGREVGIIVFGLVEMMVAISIFDYENR